MNNLLVKTISIFVFLFYSGFLLINETYVLDFGHNGHLVTEKQHFDNCDPLNHHGEESPADNHVVLAHLNAAKRKDAGDSMFTTLDVILPLPFYIVSLCLYTPPFSCIPSQPAKSLPEATSTTVIIV